MHLARGLTQAFSGAGTEEYKTGEANKVDGDADFEEDEVDSGMANAVEGMGLE